MLKIDIPANFEDDYAGLDPDDTELETESEESEDSEDLEDVFGETKEEKKEEKEETKTKEPLKSVSQTRRGRKAKEEKEKETLSQRERLAAATDLKKSRELPKLPVDKRGGKVDKRTFFEWIGLLTEPQWSRVMVYVYRLFPKIDRTLKFPNGDKNIDIISESLTEADFLGRHGGGKYRFIVTDTEAENRNDNKLFVSEPEWAWHDTPPVLEYETLLHADRDNKAFISWATAKGILKPPTEEKPDPNSSLQGITNTLLATVLEDRKKPVEPPARRSEDSLANTLITKVLESQSPEKQLGVITTLLTALKPATPEISIKDMLEMQRQEAAAREALILKFLAKEEKTREESNANREEPKSLAEQLKEAKELANLLGMAPAGSGSGGGEWVEKLMPFLQAAMAMGMQFLQQRATIPTTNPTQQIGASPFAPQLPMASPQATSITSNPTNPNPPVMETPEMLDPRLMMLKQAIAVVAQPMLNTINKGETGIDFALWVIEGYGRQTYDMVSSAGSETLLEVIKTMPELWQVVLATGNEAKFSKMVGEFCNRDEVDKALAGEDEEEVEEKEIKKAEDLFNN